MLRSALICGLLWGSSIAAPPSARNPGSKDHSNTIAKERRLKGKFLHITDFHPDPFYKTYSSTAEDAACHREHGPAGTYGAETSACDSPFSLINETFRWIKDNVKDDIDFVIWTGDSARHDNDELIPRTQSEVVQQNEFMVSKFTEVFGLDDDNDGHMDRWAVPIVPTFGNNDILPHNIFLAGPNRWTTKYLDVWRSIIPEAQGHQFQQGGWFTVEVIPGSLAVISLNTLYFFSSNSGVDGCANKHEPGYEHMEWLRIQLQILRERGLKAILMGHVPPARVDSKESWDETCWQKYTLWQRQFRDVIVGNLYGHMNIDHFMLQDFDQISKDAEKGRMASGVTYGSTDEQEIGLYEEGEITVAGASSYLLQLREAWAQLPAPAKSKEGPHSKSTYDENQEDEDEESSAWEWLMSMVRSPSIDGSAGRSRKRGYLEKIGGKFAERYSVTHVAPSVVPNYFPTLRIIEYNITGLEHEHILSSDSTLMAANTRAKQLPIGDTDLDDDDGEDDQDPTTTILGRKKKPKKGPKKYKFKVPEGPSKSSPPGPAYSPQSLTWTGYTQYFANLTRINNDFVEDPPTLLKRSRASKSTNEQSPHTIFGLTISSTGEIENRGWKEGKHGKHQGKQPRPEPHPNEFSFEVEYDTRKDKKFPDLTVRRWVEYARQIGHGNDTSAEIEEWDEEEQLEDEDTEVDGNKGGKKHKKKKGKKRKHHKASKEWFTFVRRAFVGTMDPHEIEELFGTGSPVGEVPEIVEL